MDTRFLFTLPDNDWCIAVEFNHVSRDRVPKRRTFMHVLWIELPGISVCLCQQSDLKKLEWHDDANNSIQMRNKHSGSCRM